MLSTILNNITSNLYEYNFSNNHIITNNTIVGEIIDEDKKHITYFNINENVKNFLISKRIMIFFYYDEKSNIKPYVYSKNEFVNLMLLIKEYIIINNSLETQKDNYNDITHLNNLLDYYRWKNLNEEKPSCLKIGDWDGKQSEVILLKNDETNRIYLAVCYQVNNNYNFYTADEGEFEITDNVTHFRYIDPYGEYKTR